MIKFGTGGWRAFIGEEFTQRERSPWWHKHWQTSSTMKMQHKMDL